MSFIFGKGVNTTTRADKIASFQSTTCDFGTPLPIIYGTAKRGPNLINFQDFYAKEVKTRQKTGKKSSSTTINYHYYVYKSTDLNNWTQIYYSTSGAYVFVSEENGGLY